MNAVVKANQPLALSERHLVRVERPLEPTRPGQQVIRQRDNELAVRHTGRLA